MAEMPPQPIYLHSGMDAATGIFYCCGALSSVYHQQ
jgi:hypothetical protein